MTFFRQKISESFHFLSKQHSISIIDAARFFGRFCFSYTFFWLSLYSAQRIQSGSISFTSAQWITISVIPFFLVFFTYIRERKLTKTKENQLKQDKLIRNCIESAIKEIIENGGTIKKNKAEFARDILNYIRAVTEVLLEENGSSRGTICTNLMLRDNDILKLEYFSSFVEGRGVKGFELKIDFENPDPGAPSACVEKSVIYVDDILSDTYKEYFFPNDRDKFRSFISIPIFDKKNQVFAILNIDSDIKNQFHSQEFISKIIAPKIKAIYYLFKFIS